jgi:hypothetical protein
MISAPDNLTLCACWGFLSVAPVVALPLLCGERIVLHLMLRRYREGLCALRWGLLFFVVHVFFFPFLKAFENVRVFLTPFLNLPEHHTADETADFARLVNDGDFLFFVL